MGCAKHRREIYIYVSTWGAAHFETSGWNWSAFLWLPQEDLMGSSEVLRYDLFFQISRCAVCVQYTNTFEVTMCERGISHSGSICQQHWCVFILSEREHCSFLTDWLQLAPDDAWKCPHCKQLQQGMVKMSLWTLPDILILHLKRFRQVQ